MCDNFDGFAGGGGLGSPVGLEWLDREEWIAVQVRGKIGQGACYVVDGRIVLWLGTPGIDAFRDNKLVRILCWCSVGGGERLKVGGTGIPLLGSMSGCAVV